MNVFCVVMGFIMFGPNTTLEMMRTNINFLLDVGIIDNPHAVFNSLMLIRDSKLFSILEKEDRIIEPKNFWELPKYRFKDPITHRASLFWDGIFGQYPPTADLTRYMIQLENIIARITNPMNAEALHRLRGPYEKLKEDYVILKKEFGQEQYNHFNHILDMMEAGRKDTELKEMKNAYFSEKYAFYLPRYQKLHDDFVQRIMSTGLGASGLLFKHFYSNMINQGKKRVA